MSVPKKQQTKSASNQRRSHNALKKVNLASCPKCKKAILPHTACLNCGTYKGRQVLTIKEKGAKKAEAEKKKKERKEKKEKAKKEKTVKNKK